MRRFVSFIVLASFIAIVSSVEAAPPPPPKNNPPMPPKNNPPMPPMNPPMPPMNNPPAPPKNKPPIIVPVFPVNPFPYPPPIVVRPAPIIIVETPIIATEYGMLITEQSRTGPASQAGMRVKDIILSVGGRRVQSFDQLAGALALADGPVEVVFYNSETQQTEKTLVTPVNGRIGIATEPVAIR